MRVRESQRLGSLMLLIALLAVYAGHWLYHHYPQPIPPLPWGDPSTGTIAVEVRGKQGTEGIYFFPPSSVDKELSKILGHEVRIEHSGAAAGVSSVSTAFLVTLEGDVPKVMDMPSTTRLALGLPMDLNRATREELCLVPGIGEMLAERIVQTRQERGTFDSLADLTAVPGIKDRRLRSLEKYLFVKPAP